MTFQTSKELLGFRVGRSRMNNIFTIKQISTKKNRAKKGVFDFC